MSKTVGCTDFNQNCDFRITTPDDDVDLLVESATDHALRYHPEFADNHDDMSDLIRDQVKSLMLQSHTDPSEMPESY